MPKSFEFLFHRFTSSAVTPNYYDGYRILDVDDSDLCIDNNLNYKENYLLTNENVKGYNLLHLNDMYDLIGRIYVDSIVQPRMKKNEFQSLIDTVIALISKNKL